MTFIGYENLFSQIEKGDLLVPISYLKNDKNIDSLVSDIIENFDSFEGISFSSFLNTIVQTHRAEESQKFGWNEVKHCGIVNYESNKDLIFHRDNLLFLIVQLIKKDKTGNKQITGQKTFENARNYYKSLLLINSKAVFRPLESEAEQNILRNVFLREYPYYYIPDIVETIYRLRFQRYWHIYNDLLGNFRQQKIQEGINIITEEYGLSLKEYFHVLSGIFTWFLIAPNTKLKDPTNNDLKKIGFDPKNTETYYIRRQNFGDDSDLFRLIKKLSLNLNDFKIKLQKKRNDRIDGFYEDFQCFFDFPIFEIDSNNYCIIDLKFLFEGLCAGFLWRINEISPSNLQEIKEQYGYLLEIYFHELLKNIFGDQAIQVPDGEGNPDAILETDTHIFIIEFTVEYFRFASLYSENTTEFQKDVYRLLFNEGKHDLNARNKKDKGKFHKLNDYLDKYKNSKKTIIPILVTENYVGDFDLLDRFNGQLNKNIVSKNLHNLKLNKPLILNLDDLEVFWTLSNSKKATEQFIDFVETWNILAEKGPYHFSFSNFISNKYRKDEIDNKSNNLFNWKNFVEKLK